MRMLIAHQFHISLTAMVIVPTGKGAVMMSYLWVFSGYVRSMEQDTGRNTLTYVRISRNVTY